jgi:FkbM family methyltransferase
MIDFSRISSGSWIGRFVRAPLKLIPRQSVVPILQGPLRGKKWIVGSGPHGYWTGCFEKEKQLAFARAIKPDDTVWDIGANVGFYTLLAASKAREVYAFEPLSDNVHDLERHLSLNNVDNTRVFEVALGDKDGKCNFDPCVSRLQGYLSDDGGMSVTARTIDSLTREGLEPPTLIKMDIEGAEVKCLLGALETIRQMKPRIFLAAHWGRTKGPCVAILTALGYQFDQIGDDAEDLICTFDSVPVHTLH